MSQYEIAEISKMPDTVPWFMEYTGDRADVLWLWEGWAPCLDAWKAMSCCSRGRLKRLSKEINYVGFKLNG